MKIIEFLRQYNRTNSFLGTWNVEFHCRVGTEAATSNVANVKDISSLGDCFGDLKNFEYYKLIIQL